MTKDRDDFVAFCETVSGRPLTAQQRALARVLSEGQIEMFSRAVEQQRHQAFIRGLRANLLIVDDVALSTEAAKLANEAEHSPAKPHTD